MTTATEKTLPRLKERYRNEIVAQLREQHSYGNPMQVRGWSRSSSTWVSARLLATPS
ncbi:hypothetical protein GCM10027614_57800 [Micromonospora vulcania]